MKSIWTENHTVKSYDVDSNGKLSLRMILSHLQDAGGNHAIDLGVGFFDFRELDLFWALSRVRIDIIQLPEPLDKIMIRTWPKGFDSIFTVRDLQIMNEKGDVLINISSYWLIVNLTTRRPLRPAGFIDNMPHTGDKFAIDEKLGKLKSPDVYEDEFDYLVKYSDIDVNGHVSNIAYSGWILDIFDLKFWSENRITSFEINYLHEIKYNTNITLKRSKTNDSEYIVGGYDTDRQCFIAKISIAQL